MSSSRFINKDQLELEAGVDREPMAFWGRFYTGAAPGEVARHDTSDLPRCMRQHGERLWPDCLLTLSLNLALRTTT